MSSKDSKQLFETTTRCPSCNKPFGRETRQLGCLHHFCLECLQEQETGSISQKQIRCITCKRLTIIPSGQEAKHLPKPVPVTFFQNAVEEVTNKPENQQGSLMCDLCDPVGADSIVYCLRCQKKLCAACYKAHQKEKTLKSHDTLPITETFFCKEHQNQLISLFCSDCDAGLCLKCVLQGHDKSHKKHNIQELVKCSRKDIQEQLERQEQCYCKIKDLRDKVIEIRKGVASDKAYDALHSQLDAYRDALLNTIQDSVSALQSQIKSQREEFTKNMDCVERLHTSQTSLREYAKRVQKESSVIDVATQAPHVLRLLSTSTELPPQIYYLPLDDTLRHMSQEISEQLANFKLPYKEGWQFGATEAANKVFRSPEKSSPSSPGKPKMNQAGEASYPIIQRPVSKQVALCKEAVLTIGSEVTGLTFDVPSQNLFVKTVEKRKPLQLYSLQWSLLAALGDSIEGLAEGGKITMDTKRGVLVASNSDDILIIAKNGKLVTAIDNKDLAATSTFGKGLKLRGASGVGYCAMDDKYIISDTLSNHIAIIDPDSKKLVRKFGSKGSGENSFKSPMYLTYDGNGTIPAIVVSDHNNHAVKVFTTQGQLIQVYGAKGTGHGELHNPRGVCADTKGRILVCDWGNQRVVRFETRGGRAVCECLLNAEQLGGSSPKDITLHAQKGLLAVSVALKHGEYKVNVYNGYM